MAETCGDKDLIRAAGGQTYDRVCRGVFGVTLYCNRGDYDDWRVRLDELGENLLATWNRLMEIENERQDWQKTRAVRPAYDRILERIAALPVASQWGPAAAYNPFAGEEPAKVVVMVVGIATDVVCLIETMQKAIEGYGQKAPRLPHVKPEKGAQIDPTATAKEILEKAGDAAKKAGEEFAWPLAIVGGVVLTVFLFKPSLEKMLTRGTK